MKRFSLAIAAVGLVGCQPAPRQGVSFQQDIREPTQELYRWDDTSLGVVCYGRYSSVTLSCVKVTP